MAGKEFAEDYGIDQDTPAIFPESERYMAVSVGIRMMSSTSLSITRSEEKKEKSLHLRDPLTG